MSRKNRWIIYGVNLLLIIAVLWSGAFSVERKTAAYTNKDITRYKSLNTIPKLGSITNNRTAEINFSLYDEKLYGIDLFFYVSGEDTKGDITCTLKKDGDVISSQVIEVKELFALMSETELQPKEILFGGYSCDGEYTLLLEGNNIAKQTRISLYGNRENEYFLNYVNANYQNYNNILYIVETLKPKHPYLWVCLFLLSMSLVFSVIIFINDKEKMHE